VSARSLKEGPHRRFEWQPRAVLGKSNGLGGYDCEKNVKMAWNEEQIGDGNCSTSTARAQDVLRGGKGAGPPLKKISINQSVLLGVSGLVEGVCGFWIWWSRKLLKGRVGG